MKTNYFHIYTWWSNLKRRLNILVSRIPRLMSSELLILSFIEIIFENKMETDGIRCCYLKNLNINKYK